MESPVIVQTQEEFDAWIKEQVEANAAAEASGVPDASRGQRIYESSGCKACHSIDGSRLVGPTWKGLWGEAVELEDGSTLLRMKLILLNRSGNLMPGLSRVSHLECLSSIFLTGRLPTSLNS